MAFKTGACLLWAVQGRMCLNDLFVNVAGSAARLPEHVIGHLLWNVVLLIGYQVGSFCRYIADRKVCV